VRRSSLVRIWLVGHHGIAVLGVQLALTVVLCGGSDALLPVPGSMRPMPVWQLIPALYAMPVALGTVSRIPEPASPAIRRARGLWIVWLVAVSAGCVRLVGATTTHLPDLTLAACFLVLVTIAGASLLGRSAAGVGVAVAVYLVVHTADYPSAENPWEVHLGAVVLGACAAVALGLAAYVGYGARGSVRLE
jgi:hypothetical protein